MAPSFSSYLTLLTSAFAKVEAMLPRIKPKSNLPKTITKLARTIRRRERQWACTWNIPYYSIRRLGRWLIFFVLRVPVIRGGRLFQPGRSLNFPYSQQVVLVNFPTNIKSLFFLKKLKNSSWKSLISSTLPISISLFVSVRSLSKQLSGVTL